MFFNNSLVAVDIGSSAIKMLELSGNSQRLNLKNFGIEALPRGAIEHGSFVDAAVVTQTLKKLVKKLGVKGRRAAVAVSGGGVMIKKVVINSGKDATVNEQVDFHAAQAFQLDLAEIYYDYAEMGMVPNGGDGVEVLIAGARRELVEQYVSVVKASGLELGVIEASALSLANMFEINYGVVDGLIALISVGASNTQVGFVDRGRFLYSHEVPFGGDAYTAAISQTMSMPMESAEALKISAASNPGGLPGDFQRVLNETNNALVSDIKQIFNFFVASPDAEGQGVVKHVFLTGGASRTVGLDTAVASTLGVPVLLANPFQNIEINERKFKLEHLLSLCPMFGVSIGLGIRSKGDKAAA